MSALPPHRRTTGWQPRVLGSITAVLVGWLTAVALATLATVCLGGDLGIVALVAVVYAVLILLVWSLIFWPLYSYVPRRSVLWWWPVCTLCGLGAGTLISLLLCGAYGWKDAWENPVAIALFSVVAGGLVGAATCLCASLTADHFLGPPPPDALPPWARQLRALPLGRWFPHLTNSARQSADKMLRWVRARFADLSGQ